MLSIQGVILKIDSYRSFWHALYYFLSAKNTLYGSEKKFLNSFLCLLLLIFYLLYDVIGKYIFNRTKIEQISKWHCMLLAETCPHYRLSNKTCLNFFFCFRNINSCIFSGLNTFEHPCHVFSKCAHRLKAFQILFHIRR